MKVPQYRYRCPLGNLQPTTPDLDAVKREGWRTDHILVVSEHDNRLDWVEKEFVRRLGERLYGPDGHPKLLHLWPVKLLQAGRSDYDYVGVMAMREAASFRR